MLVKKIDPLCWREIPPLEHMLNRRSWTSKDPSLCHQVGYTVNALSLSCYLLSCYLQQVTLPLWCVEGHCGFQSIRFGHLPSKSEETEYIQAPKCRLPHDPDPLRSLSTWPKSSEVIVHMSQILWDHCPMAQILWGHLLLTQPRSPEVIAHTTQILWGHYPHSPDPLRSLRMTQNLWGHCPWPSSSESTAYCILNFSPSSLKRPFFAFLLPPLALTLGLLGRLLFLSFSKQRYKLPLSLSSPVDPCSLRRQRAL